MVFAPASVLIARVLAERGDARDAIAELRDALRWCLHVVARAELVDDVDYGVDILGLLGHFDTAAVFAGILERGALQGLSSMPSVGGIERERRRAAHTRVRSALGDDRFEALASRGAQLSFDAAASFLLCELDALLAEPAASDDA